MIGLKKDRTKLMQEENKKERQRRLRFRQEVLKSLIGKAPVVIQHERSDIFYIFSQQSRKHYNESTKKDIFILLPCNYLKGNLNCKIEMMKEFHDITIPDDKTIDFLKRSIGLISMPPEGEDLKDLKEIHSKVSLNFHSKASLEEGCESSYKKEVRYNFHQQGDFFKSKIDFPLFAITVGKPLTPQQFEGIIESESETKNFIGSLKRYLELLYASIKKDKSE